MKKILYPIAVGFVTKEEDEQASEKRESDEHVYTDLFVQARKEGLAYLVDPDLQTFWRVEDEEPATPEELLAGILLTFAK